MKRFLAWWTADHVQAVKKLVIAAAGVAVYLLPHGSLWSTLAAAAASCGMGDSICASLWKAFQDSQKKDAALQALKSFGFLAVLGLALGGAPARAGGFDWSTGPTLPLLEYEFGKSVPVQVAAGAGLQASITHDALKVDLGGKYWDLVDLTGMAFGSIINPTGTAPEGQLSVALGLSFFSSLVGIAVGHHILGPDASLSGGWFWTLTLSINFALVPAPPPSFSAEARPWLPRGNTVYLFGG